MQLTYVLSLGFRSRVFIGHGFEIVLRFLSQYYNLPSTWRISFLNSANRIYGTWTFRGRTVRRRIVDQQTLRRLESSLTGEFTDRTVSPTGQLADRTVYRTLTD